MFRRALFVLVAALLPSGVAWAVCMEVTLRSGDVVRGESVTSDQSKIELRLEDGTTRVIPRSEIAKAGLCGNGVKREQAPESKKPSEGVKEPESTSGGKTTPYLIVPIIGKIGADVIPSGLADALDHARKKRIRHVVLDINSPGGYVASLDEFKEVLARYDAEIEYIALVRESLSAAMLFTLLADRVVVVETARAGAAVAFSTQGSSGAIEVDARLNSALAADFAGFAQLKGRNPVIARAMVVMAEEVWACSQKDSPGSLAFATENDARQACGDPSRVDGPDTVLTLTASQMAEFGFAEGVVKNEEEIGKALGLPGWKRYSNFGAASMEKAAARIREEIESIRSLGEELRKSLAAPDSLVDAVHLSARDAERLHPAEYSYSYYQSGGELTPQSKTDWRDRTDSAISAWKAVLDRIARIVKLERETAEFVKESPEDGLYFLVTAAKREAALSLADPLEKLQLLGHDLGAVRDQASRTIDELRKNRERNYR